MDFTQVIAFITANGGATPGLCLANVCKGYGIPNKYGSAWEAWGHTQQHADRDIPSGVAVPIFYSYTTTIDGVTANYGHINVQLPNGTVWSDGNIYASIDDYMSKKFPRFVGWGESVNDFKVIEGGGMTPEQAAELQDALNYKTQVTSSNAWADPNGFSNDVSRVAPHINNLMADRIATTTALGIPVTSNADQITAAINALKSGSVSSVVVNGVNYKPE